MTYSLFNFYFLLTLQLNSNKNEYTQAYAFLKQCFVINFKFLNNNNLFLLFFYDLVFVIPSNTAHLSVGLCIYKIVEKPNTIYVTFLTITYINVPFHFIVLIVVYSIQVLGYPTFRSEQRGGLIFRT